MKRQSHAQRVQPARHRVWGKINWFGGKYSTLDYGFIQVPGEPDLFVHASECQCRAESLSAGTAVTFEKYLHPKSGKFQARSVRLLEDEEDKAVIDQCVISADAAYAIPAWCATIRRMNIMDAVAAIRDRRSEIDRNGSAYVHRLPVTILRLPESRWLREKLSGNEHIRHCIAMLMCESEVGDLRQQLYDELTMRISSVIELNGLFSWSSVPCSIVQDPAFGRSMIGHLQRRSVQSADNIRRLHLPDAILALPESRWLRERLSRNEHIHLCITVLMDELSSGTCRMLFLEELAERIMSEIDWDGSVSWPDIPLAIVVRPTLLCI